jgi:hypothetical protein
MIEARLKNINDKLWQDTYNSNLNCHLAYTNDHEIPTTYSKLENIKPNCIFIGKNSTNFDRLQTPPTLEEAIKKLTILEYVKMYNGHTCEEIATKFIDSVEISTKICTICQENQSNKALQCGHTLCITCFRIDNLPCCHICRTPITTIYDFVTRNASHQKYLKKISATDDILDIIQQPITLTDTNIYKILTKFEYGIPSYIKMAPAMAKSITGKENPLGRYEKLTLL